jgi:hypothetical protein
MNSTPAASNARRTRSKSDRGARDHLESVRRNARLDTRSARWLSGHCRIGFVSGDFAALISRLPSLLASLLIIISRAV